MITGAACGEPFPCPVGTYASVAGAASAAACTPCPAGTWNPAAGATAERSARLLAIILGPPPSSESLAQLGTVLYAAVCRIYSHKFNMGDTSFEKISFLGCFIDILLRPIFLNQNSDKIGRSRFFSPIFPSQDIIVGFSADVAVI
jgi:hypothetical protein